MFRWVMLRLLSRVREGQITLVEGARRTVMGAGGDLAVEVRVNDRRAWRATALHTSIGLADSYVDGRWDCEDLVGLVRIAARNMRGFDRLKRRLAFAMLPWQRVGAALRPATLRRARRDVQAHYDLSNALYELFLD